MFYLVVSNYFLNFSPIPGEMTQIEVPIFLMGWFNHRRVFKLRSLTWIHCHSCVRGYWDRSISPQSWRRRTGGEPAVADGCWWSPRNILNGCILQKHQKRFSSLEFLLSHSPTWSNYNDQAAEVTLNGGEKYGNPTQNPLNSGLGIRLIWQFTNPFGNSAILLAIHQSFYIHPKDVPRIQFHGTLPSIVFI